MRLPTPALLLIAALPVALPIALPAVLPTAAHALDAQARRGETIARTNCARCHAIGRVGASPLAEAPPFTERLSQVQTSEKEFSGLLRSRCRGM